MPVLRLASWSLAAPAASESPYTATAAVSVTATRRPRRGPSSSTSISACHLPRQRSPSSTATISDGAQHGRENVRLGVVVDTVMEPSRVIGHGANEGGKKIDADVGVIILVDDDRRRGVQHHDMAQAALEIAATHDFPHPLRDVDGLALSRRIDLEDHSLLLKKHARSGRQELPSPGSASSRRHALRGHVLIRHALQPVADDAREVEEHLRGDARVAASGCARGIARSTASTSTGSVATTSALRSLWRTRRHLAEHVAALVMRDGATLGAVTDEYVDSCPG